MSSVTIQKTELGRWKVRWRDGGRGARRPSRTFDRMGDADRFAGQIKRELQLGGVVRLEQDQPTLSEYVETFWRLHAIPNLAPTTRSSYANIWNRHARPRLGHLRLGQLTRAELIRFRADLEDLRDSLLNAVKPSPGQGLASASPGAA